MRESPIDQAQQAWAATARVLAEATEECRLARVQVQRCNTNEHNAKAREESTWAALVKLREEIGGKS